MDAFDQACERVPARLEMLIEATPGRLHHADVFAHSIRQCVVEARSSQKGLRFGAPNWKRRETSVEGIAIRTISDTDDRFAATPDLSPSGFSTLLKHESSNEDISPCVTETNHCSGADPDTDSGGELRFVAETIHDVLLGTNSGLKSAWTQVVDITTRRAVSAMDSLPSTFRDHQTRIEVRVVVGIGDRDLSAVRTVLATSWDGLDAQRIALSIGHELAGRLSETPNRISGPEGSLPVILPSGWGGVWMHEAIGHQVEFDSILSGTSVFTNRINQKVGPSGLTILDTPRIPGGRVNQAFDDEGTPSSETVVVEEGRFVGVLNDRLSSLREGRPLTGNGRRAHYAQKPRPRMTNLVLESGTVSPGDLLSGLKHGIEVGQIGHAWFSPSDKRVYVHVLESRLIRDGHPTDNLEPLTLSASCEEILERIEGIGDDFSMDADRGYCVKDGAAIPVGVGQPTVLISSMDVAPTRT